MRYRILGPLEVSAGDEPVHLGGGRQRAFLALLLIHANSVVSTDRIIDELWGDEPPDTVHNVIQVYVSRLRKALEPDRARGDESTVLLTRRPGYLLAVTPEQLDAHQFTDLLERGRDALAQGSMGIAATLLSQALDLWRGDALADLAFEDFARTEIERLHEARLVCRESLFEARLALGDHETLVGELEAAVAEYPLREQFWAHLMVALYRSGRQAEALRAYRRAADRLVEELGIDPSPQLQELEERILGQDPALDAPTPTRQPLSIVEDETPPPLTVRPRDLAAVADGFVVLEAGRSVLVTMTGSPGTGVGRFLAEIDRLARGRGFEVREATAHPTSVSQAGEVVRALGDLGDDRPLVLLVRHVHHADPTSLAAIRRRLADKPTMVVAGFDPAAAGRRRQSLAVLEAGTVAGGGTVVPIELGAVDAGTLERIIDARLVEPLLAATGGRPGDISDQLMAWKAAGLVAWDDHRVWPIGDAPPSEAPTVLSRLAELPPGERRLVEACALAGRPVPLSVAQCLAGLERDDAIEVIERLAAAGFVRETSGGVVPADGLAVHRVIEQMGPTRKAAVFADLARCFEGAAPDRAIGWYASMSHDDRRAADLLASEGLAEIEAGNLGEAEHLLEGARSAKDRLGERSDSQWGMIHLGLAQCRRLAGWSEQAAADLDVAIPLLEGAALVDALGWAAQVADDLQEPGRAEWWVARAERAAILDEAPDKLGSLLSLRARVLNRLAFPDEADVCAEKAADHLARHGGRRQRYLADYNRAWVAFDRGETREAEAAFDRLLDLAEGEGLRADVLAWHGRALFRMGKVAEALEALDRAYAIGARTGDGGPVFLSHLGRAEGALAFGMLDVAERATDEFTGIVLHQLPAWENVARYLRARLALARDDRELAANEIANAVDLSERRPGGRRWWLAARALQVEVGEETGGELERLIEEAESARWHSTEVPLLAWASRARDDAELLRRAVDVALEHGLLMAAVEAVAPQPEAASELGRVREAFEKATAGQPAEWTAGPGSLLQPKR